MIKTSYTLEINFDFGFLDEEKQVKEADKQLIKYVKGLVKQINEKKLGFHITAYGLSRDKNDLMD